MIENHPLEPFLPENAKVLMLGSFPPPKKRWKIDFYYPNFQNDMWRIFGIVFFSDALHFIDVNNNTYKKDEIVDFLKLKGIAIFDAAKSVIRETGDASDANLTIHEPTDIPALLSQIPECEYIVSTGGKSSETIADMLGIKKAPKIGTFAEAEIAGRIVKFYRLPSSSRAYPLKLEKKAEAYKILLDLVQ